MTGFLERLEQSQLTNQLTEALTRLSNQIDQLQRDKDGRILITQGGRWQYSTLTCQLYVEGDFGTLARVIQSRIETAGEGWEPISVNFADLRHAVVIMRRPKA